MFRIAEGQYYEAHQQLRVIASRYTKAQDWVSATDILFRGAQSLLQAGQGGSGGDLCIFLLDVFNKSETKPDASSKGKLITLLRAFPPNEPTKKKFVAEMVGWSAKYGEYPAGDPEIHHVAGSAYAEGMSPRSTDQLRKLRTNSKHRSRALRCRASPRPRHKRLPRNPRQPRIRLVHSRRLAHRPALYRTRRSPIPARGQSACSEQVLPALYQPAIVEARATDAASLNLGLRLACLPFATAAQLPWVVVVECGARRSEFVPSVEEPLCRAFEGYELGRGAGSDWRDVLWYQDTEAGKPHV